MTTWKWMRGATAESWNKQVPVGSPVRYWPVLPTTPHFPPVETRTRSEAWVLGDDKTVIVKVNGYAGGVHVDHLEIEVEAPRRGS